MYFKELNLMSNKYNKKKSKKEGFDSKDFANSKIDMNTKERTLQRFQRNGDYSLPVGYRASKPIVTKGFDHKLGDNKFYPPSLSVTLENLHQFPFLNYQDHRKDYFTRAQESTYGKEVTEFSSRFFSQKNIKLIQKLIKNAIRIKTKNKISIDDQDENDLIVIMQSAYYEYGRDVPRNINKQLFELNSVVVQSIVPGILTNIKQYLLYIRDISLPRVILDQPQAVNGGGRKQLPSITTLFS